jgi:transposase
MWHVGIDLHRNTVVIAAVNDSGEAFDPVTLSCRDEGAIVAALEALRPFRAVIEASETYRWLHKLISPLGTVLLAHPLKLRVMIQRRSKTDKIDAMLLAQLLRIDQVPLAYIPSERYQYLREVTRYRVRIGRDFARIKTEVKALLARHNVYAPYENLCGVRGVRWLATQEFGCADDLVRDHLLERVRALRLQIEAVDERLEAVCKEYPEAASLLDIYGIGVYTALLITGELGEVERFCREEQVGAYAGLTAKVNQSGGHCYYGHIAKQGSGWLRWALVGAAMKVIRRDVKLANFYQRVRKRSSSKIARVAVARKLAEICWKRLRRWKREHADREGIGSEGCASEYQSVLTAC